MKRPDILQLDVTGIPYQWITYENAATLYSKGRVAWTMGNDGYRIHGGVQRISGKQSFMDLDSIIAVREENNKKNRSYLFNVPRPSAYILFRRDKNLCAYCGNIFKDEDLTKDHITPQSRNGECSWMNLVTCCRSCNNRKEDKTPEEANMKLLYVPYIPCRSEWLILQNRKILVDQMKFLMSQVPKTSRLYEKI